MRRVTLLMVFLGLNVANGQYPELFKQFANASPNNYSVPAPTAVINNSLLIQNDTLNYGQLWATDGDSSNFVFLKTCGDNCDLAYNYVNFNGNLYYETWDSLGNIYLNETDGTLTGTQVIKQLWDTGMVGATATRFTNSIFFITRSLPGSGLPSLIQSDGTAARTYEPAALHNAGLNFIYGYTFLNDKIILLSGPEYGGIELWVSDGTDSGTIRLESGIWDYIWQEQPSVTSGDLFYFLAEDSVEGLKDLWVTDGTILGTQMLKKIGNGPGVFGDPQMTVYKNRIYFTGGIPDSPSVGATVNIWVTDGTAANTYIFQSFGLRDYSWVSGYAVMDDKLYYVASNYFLSTTLYVTDGTEGGTHGIYTFPSYVWGGGYEGNATPFNHYLYFNVTDSIAYLTQDQVLWITDGTDSGTHEIKVKIGNDSAALEPPTYFVQFRGDLYFGAMPMVDSALLLPGIWRIRGPRDNTTSSSDIKEQGQLGIYPNPANNTLKIKNIDLSMQTNVEIINTLGETMIWVKLTSPELDISKLASGAYLLKCSSNDGETKTAKFIKF